MVRCSKQRLHLVVSINHVLLRAVDILSQLLNLCVLSLNLTVEVLRFVLSGLDDSDDLLKLPILILEHILLQPEHLFVIQVARLVELTVLTALVASSLLCGSHSGLIVLDGTVFLSELSVD